MCAESKKNKKEYFLSLSYRDLEAVTGVYYATWHKWFARRRSPTIDSLEEAAKTLDMPLLEFVEAFKERRDKTIAANAQKKVAA